MSRVSTCSCQFSGNRSYRSCVVKRGRRGLKRVLNIEQADLVEWPPGLRPASGRVQVGHLTNLGEFHLRHELKKRNSQASGSTVRLAKRLYALVQQEAMELGLDEKTQSRKRYVLPAPPSPPAAVQKLRHLEPKKRLGTIQENQSGMYLSILGSGTGISTEFRHEHSVALNVNQELWLFDVSEDTQRQILGLPDVRGGRMTRIFLTGKSKEELWGLPGILCTISESREIVNPQMNNPINIYGPPGIVQFIFNMMELSDTYISMPVIIHELHSTKVDETHHRRIAERSRLYSIDIPADQYNPDGWFNGELTSFSLPPMSKRQKAEAILFSKQTSKLDLRAGYRPQAMPPPGRPNRRAGLPPWELSWTIRCGSAYTIVAVPMKYSSPSYAYIIKESARAGKLFPERAKSLNVQSGISFQKLKQGQSVLNADGQTVTPDMVMGYDRPGRKIVICGHSTDMRSALEPAKGADVVLVKAPMRGRTQNLNHLTSFQAGKFGSGISAGTLIISCLKDRDSNLKVYSEEDRRQHMGHVAKEVKQNYKGNLILAEDEDIYIVERRYVTDVPFWAKKEYRYHTSEFTDDDDDDDDDEDYEDEEFDLV